MSAACARIGYETSQRQRAVAARFRRSPGIRTSVAHERGSRGRTSLEGESTRVLRTVAPSITAVALDAPCDRQSVTHDGKELERGYLRRPSRPMRPITSEVLSAMTRYCA